VPAGYSETDGALTFPGTYGLNYYIGSNIYYAYQYYCNCNCLCQC
jgi:hypothetical protein